MLTVVSGGLDSAVLAHLVGKDQLMVSFDYGQRHVKELHSAARIAAMLGVEHLVVDLRSLGGVLPNNALTGGSAVPHGHYAAENMKITVVPNRNVIMLSCAFAIAAAHKIDSVWIAVHAGDHYIYPDCRPAFMTAYEAMQKLALEGFPEIALHSPFINMTKANIVTLGTELGVPFKYTWSCYEGNELHCGRCGTCVERKLAFKEAGIFDPTIYADKEYGLV